MCFLFVFQTKRLWANKHCNHSVVTLSGLCPVRGFVVSGSPHYDILISIKPLYPDNTLKTVNFGQDEFSGPPDTSTLMFKSLFFVQLFVIEQNRTVFFSKWTYCTVHSVIQNCFNDIHPSTFSTCFTLFQVAGLPDLKLATVRPKAGHPEQVAGLLCTQLFTNAHSQSHLWTILE